MIFGLTYLLTPLTLALILALAASTGHEDVSEDVKVFRYQRGYVKVLACCVAVPAIMAFFVYMVTIPHPRGFALIGYFAMGIVGTAIFYAGYRYVLSYRIELHKACLYVSVLGRDREIRYTDLAEVGLIVGLKRHRSLVFRLKDPEAKPLEVSESISDFDYLFEHLKERLLAANVAVRFRDRWGKWSESPEGFMD